METVHEEDWETLKTLLPKGWKDLGKECGAIKRLREFKNPEVLMRVLLIHLAKGYSLRETAAIAKQVGLAKVSDVAILKRLRSCESWFHGLAYALLAKRDVQLDLKYPELNIKLVDGTTVREPGKTGSEWLIHYSVNVPSLSCDFFELTPKKGWGHGETLDRFPVKDGDLLVGDRGYCTENGINGVLSCGGEFLVRLTPSNLPMNDNEGASLDLKHLLNRLRRAGDTGEMEARLSKGSKTILRVCAVRKTETAIELAHKKLRRNASKKQHKVRPETFEYAKYVMVITSLPRQKLNAEQVLELYRLRWQVELVFKRFKSIAHLGHLPKKDPASARSWLYGKLFIALLADKLATTASSISPWGLVGINQC